MKQTEVPQDNIHTFNGERKALYAFNDNDECVITPSSGWSVEEMATMQAVEEFKRLEKEAYEGFLNQDVSPLAVWMYRRRMSILTLASCMGYWQWKVRSHLKYKNGYPVSEAMAFGIGYGLSFAYLPMVKLDGMPLVAYRMLPRGIIKALTKRLGITLNIKRYSSPLKAQNELIDMVDSGKIVGLQTSVYWLPYFPTEMRFHFNAHNLIVYGREEENFLIGDPVFEHTVSASFNDLTKARFAKGVFAPKGTCYTIGEIPKDINLPKVIKKSIARRDWHRRWWL
ncbi:MAG: BtrH N-terminal domain-containing protein [Sulfurovaceae bacterium]